MPAFIERPVISVAIAANGAMYAGTYDGLYRSIDASVNWSKIEINGQITSIVHSTAPHPTDANTLMVGTNDTVQLDRVWKTTDGGSSWTNRTPSQATGMTPAAIRFSAANPDDV